MKDTLRWAYALNQWNVRLDVFVRHEDQQRALQDRVRLRLRPHRARRRHRPLGQPQPARGDPAQPRQPRRLPGVPPGRPVQGVSSMFWDPGQPVEEEGWAFRSTANPADHDAIVESAKPFVDFLAGGRRRTARRPAGRVGLDEPAARTPDALKTVGEVWNRVGELAAAAGSASPCTTTAWARCTPRPN